MLNIRKRTASGGRKITSKMKGPFYCGMCGRQVKRSDEECGYCGCQLDDVYDAKPDSMAAEIQASFDGTYPNHKPVDGNERPDVPPGIEEHALARGMARDELVYALAKIQEQLPTKQKQYMISSFRALPDKVEQRTRHLLTLRSQETEKLNSANKKIAELLGEVARVKVEMSRNDVSVCMECGALFYPNVGQNVGECPVCRVVMLLNDHMFGGE